MPLTLFVAALTESATTFNCSDLIPLLEGSLLAIRSTSISSVTSSISSSANSSNSSSSSYISSTASSSKTSSA